MILILMYDTRYRILNVLKIKIYYKGVLRMKEKRWCILTLFLIIFLIFSFKNIFNKREENLKIGILQFVEHDALDASRQGFIEKIKKSGLEAEIIYKNAQGDQSNCTLIANQFVSEKCDLIFVIATPAAQAVAAVTSNIPILVTAVTDPVDARLIKSNELPGTNVSGTSDLAPIAKQIGLIKQIKPEARNIGIFYSSNEANSKFQAEIAKKEAQKLGLNAKEFNFSHAAEIQQVVEYMSQKVDAIYTPTDNAVASNMELISKTALNFGIPVICGEENLIPKGAAGTFGVNYYELGEITAEMAIKILKFGASPQNMPIEYIKNAELVLNNEVLDKLNLKF